MARLKRRLAVWADWLFDRLSWTIAWRLPRRVTLYAFVRVYGVLGEVGPDYAPAYRAWQKGAGR